VKLVDLNVLLYAVNSAAPLHRRVLPWWERAVNGNDPVALCWPVISGFIRLSTRPGLFPRPLSVDAACARVERWLELPVVCVISESESHWSLLKHLLAEVGSAGNLTTDAHLAALALSHGATLVSCDNDFARFPGLRWENPASG
jgi:toxin-antitoxin system PIN domain toxin